ncbi:MAG: hypothetical protein ABIS45_07865 [Burkholderiales bacterium]
MQIRSHEMNSRKKPFHAFEIEKLSRSFELPDVEEFVCDDEEVREACSGLEAGHEGFAD